MADCNKTADFLWALQRYCRGKECRDCVLCPEVAGIEREKCIAMVGEDGAAYAEAIIPLLQQWANSHPAKTWLQRLEEALPGVKVDRIPNMHCPGEFFQAGTGRLFCPYEADSAHVDCWECWRQEAKDG